MIKANGSCRIDGVEVGELSYISIGLPSPVLAVKYAYVNSTSGSRLGHGTRNTEWSETTQQRLQSLLQSIEQDIATAVFEQGTTTAGSIEEELGPLPVGVTSL
jgi:hypothetical protein